MTPKKSDIARTVAEKIEFEKNLCRPLAAKPEVNVVTWPYEMKAMKRFSKSRLAPVNVCQCKMTKKFALYACTRQPKTLLRSRRLLNSSTVVYQILYICHPQSFMRGRNIDQSSGGGRGGPALSQTGVGNLLCPSTAFRLRSRSVYIQF